MQQLTSQEKAAKIAWFLAKGEELSNERVRVLTGLSRSGASRLMTKLAHVLPIVKVEGVWSTSESSSGLCSHTNYTTFRDDVSVVHNERYNVNGHDDRY